MFYIFKKLRGALKALRSETSPHEIALGAAFGVLLGFPPFGLNILLPLLPLILLRNAIGNALLFAVLSRLLAWPLAQMSFDLGVALLRESDALRGFMTWATNAPFFGLMGLNRYYVFGSLVLALPLSVVIYIAMRIFVAKFRAVVVAKVSGAAAVQKHEKKFWFKAGRWIFLGGAVKPVKQPTGIWKIVRKAGVIGLPAFLIVLTVLGVLGAQYGFGGAIAASLSAATGQPARVESSWANPFLQRVGLEGLLVEEEKPELPPLLSVDAMHFDLNTLSLVSGRVHIPELKVGGVALHLIRKPDGSLGIADAPIVTGRPADSTEPPTEAENEYVKWVQEQAANADWLEIGSKTVEFIRKRMEESAKKKKPELPFDASARESYEVAQPFFRLDKIAFSDFRIEIEDQRPGHEAKVPTIHTASFELTNLSSNRALRAEDILGTIVASIGGQENGTFSLSSNWNAPGKGSAGGDLNTNLSFTDVAIPALAALFETSIPVKVEQGKFSFASGLTLSNGAVKPSTGDLRLDQLKLAEPLPGQKLLGLDGDASRWFVKGLNAVAADEPLEMKALVDGPVERPNVRVEANLLAIAKRGVQKLALQSGQEEAKKYLSAFDGRLNEELAKLGALAPGLGGDVGAALQRDILGPLMQGDPSKIDAGKVGDALKDAGAKAAADAQKAAEDAAKKAAADLLKQGGGGDPKKALEGGLEGAKKDLQKGLGGLLGGGKTEEPKKDEPKKKKDGTKDGGGR
ncbi:MAG: TIGR03546 family protein [Planctomycetes bacterium]|nr:TIGR03546 family protein [Planctomycetota bacterium]